MAMRKALRQVPLDQGNRWAGYLFCAMLGIIIGWIWSRAAAAACFWFPIV
jgi:hypothetical protein